MDTRFPVTWTVDAVRQTLIDALWLCLVTGGPAGPMEAAPSFWPDAPDWEEDETEKAKRRRARRSPARVSFLESAIRWPAEFLADHPSEARALQLWLRCKVTKAKFVDVCQRHGIARASAYRDRDRALTIISVGLDRAGVPLWGDR